MYAIMDILDVIYFEQGLFWYQILDTLLNSYSSISQYSVLLFKRIARFTDENCTDAAARAGLQISNNR